MCQGHFLYGKLLKDDACCLMLLMCMFHALSTSYMDELILETTLEVLALAVSDFQVSVKDIMLATVLLYVVFVASMVVNMQLRKKKYKLPHSVLK